MRKIFALLVISSIVFQVSAQQQSTDISLRFSDNIHSDQYLSNLLEGGIEYLYARQRKSTNDPYYFRGEWPSYMEMVTMFPVLGRKGKKNYDSNCFTSAHIHTILAEIYNRYHEYDQIPIMLNASLINIYRYRYGDVFGFWQNLPMRYGNEKIYVEVLTRKPNHFKVNTMFLKLSAHVPADADDTAISYLALWLQDQLAQTNGAFNKPYWIPGQAEYIFEQYTDVDRINRSFYNLMFTGSKETGAYMIWFQEEEHISPVVIFPEVGHPNIPWGANEVDAVVNANVIASLAATGRKDFAFSYQLACDFVNKQVLNRRFHQSTIYYPNYYSLHYAVAKAVYYGADELSPSIPVIIYDLLEKQQGHGYFLNRNDKDTLQSTIFAVNTLLLLKKYADISLDRNIEDGLRYILSQRKEKGKYIWWPGGVFFSGGTIVKDELIWRSHDYTTALALETLMLYIDSKNVTASDY